MQWLNTVQNGKKETFQWKEGNVSIQVSGQVQILGPAWFDLNSDTLASDACSGRGRGSASFYTYYTHHFRYIFLQSAAIEAACYMDVHTSAAEGTAPPSPSLRVAEMDSIQHSNQPIYLYYTQRMERMGAESGRPSNSARARGYVTAFFRQKPSMDIVTFLVSNLRS